MLIHEFILLEKEKKEQKVPAYAVIAQKIAELCILSH
jgi:hypothetical protein